MFTVTSLYALPLAAIFLVLWMRVSAIRSSSGISFGDGGNAHLLQRVRQHGNFIEWTPFVLILMMLAEGLGAPAFYLHISGALLVLGRIAHPFGLKHDTAGHPLRYVGNGSSMLALLNACVCISVNLSGI